MSIEVSAACSEAWCRWRVSGRKVDVEDVVELRKRGVMP
jgi:hypothetical protein